MAAGGGKYSHFVAKLAPDPEKGPDPGEELRNVIEQCSRNPDGVGWLATGHGSTFERAGNSICIVFHHPDKDSPRVEALVAYIPPGQAYSPTPANADAREYYAKWKDRLTEWWAVGGYIPGETTPLAVLTTFESLAEIPGHSDKGRTAAEAFKARTAFAGWKFEPSFNTLKWLRELPGVRPTPRR